MNPRYQRLRSFIRRVLKLYFRRISVTGLESIPTDRGGLLVAWHPNGLIDPALIVATLPRPVCFGARHGLFQWPLLRSVLETVGAKPIYRSQDVAADQREGQNAANQMSLDALSRSAAEGSFATLFPEGVSHDAPHLMELKSGAARLFERARELSPEEATQPAIIPVGLHYDYKRLFRSNVQVSYHPPLVLTGELAKPPTADLSDDERQERVRSLTALIEAALHDVVHATESWELHHLLERARKLVRAERARRAGRDPGPVDIKERVAGYARVWQGYRVMNARDPERVEGIMFDLADYEAELRALGLEDHELDRDPQSDSLLAPALVALQGLAVYVLFPPLLVFGVVANAPTAALLLTMARAFGKDDKDEATIKVAFGALLFPLTWLLVGLATAWGVLHLEQLSWLPSRSLASGLLAAVTSALGGLLAVRYLRLVNETQRALKARFLRSWRARLVARTIDRRARLHDALIQLVAGVDLPGQVRPDGSIEANSPSRGD